MKVRTWVIILIVIVAAILVGARIRTISNSQNKSEAAETRLALEAMAQQDTASIQEEIDLKRTVTETVYGDISDAETTEGDENAEEAEEAEDTTTVDTTTVELSGNEVVFSDSEMLPLETLKEFNYKEIYANCVVMGDSIASGLDSFDILTSSETVTKIGSLTFEAARDQLSTAAAMNPKILFVAYGLNDTIAFGEDVDNFKQTYEDFLTKAKELMPNTTIYAIQIFPVQQIAVENNPGFQYIDIYNQAIIEACKDQGVYYMNLNFTALEPYYETDGMHMYMEFYYGWAYYMAKGAGLI